MKLMSILKKLWMKRLVNNIEEKLNEIEVNLIKTAKRAPELVEEEHQRLRKNIEKLLEGIETVDENIIANEIALYAQKADIDEEIIRLGSHIEWYYINQYMCFTKNNYWASTRADTKSGVDDNK